MKLSKLESRVAALEIAIALINKEADNGTDLLLEFLPDDPKNWDANTATLRSALYDVQNYLQIKLNRLYASLATKDT